MVNEEVTMTMSVLPGAMTGISTLMAGMVSINNIFMDVTRQIDSTFGLVDATIVTAGTVIAQFGLQAAEAFGQFEQGMKIVQMVSGQTKSDIEQLSQAANQFSVQYRTDIDQITEGLQTLGRAGLNSASEQTEVLKNGLNTAKLESRDLNGVLEELIQNTALLGGNLKDSSFGEDSGYVNDLLVATSMTAPITTHDISETLKYSGGIAAAAGAKIRDNEGNVSEEGKAILEDYMGAIAAFAQKGVTGSIAGTALRAFFNKPATQDSSVTEALSTIHLKPEYLWEDDQETMKPVSDQIKIIQDQMDKLNISTMDRLQIWSKIVGGKMGQQMMKLDSSSIKELTKDIQSADNATSLAAGSMQTFQANMKEMHEQGQVAFREFGGNVAQFINPFIDIITKVLELLSNPISGKLLFAGFLVAINKVASTVKKILSNLKSEFSQFMNYFKSGEKLMAVRPSVIRGMERKSQYSDYSAPEDVVTSKGILKDIEKEVNMGYIEKMRRRGITDSQIGVLEQTKSWSANFIKNPFNEAWLSTHGMRNNPGDNAIIRTLIESGKWKDKWTNALFNTETGVLSKEEFMKQFGGDIYAEFEKHINEAKTSVKNFTDTVTQSSQRISAISNDDYKKGLEALEKHPEKDVDKINKIWPGFKERYEKENGSEGSEKSEKTEPEEIKTTKPTRKGNEWYDRKPDIPGMPPWLLKKEKEKKNVEDKVDEDLSEDETDGKFLKNVKEAHKQEEKVDKAGAEYFAALNNELAAFLLDLENPGLKERAFRREKFDEFYGKHKMKKKDAIGIPITKQDKVLLPQDMLRDSFVSGIVPDISKEQFKNLSLSSGGVVGDIVKNANQLNNFYENFRGLVENKLRQYLDFITPEVVPNKKQPNFSYIESRGELEQAANKGGDWSYRRITDQLKSMYGIDAFGKEKDIPFYGDNGHPNLSKNNIANLAFPFLADWSITKQDDRLNGISDAELKEMAATLGMDVSKDWKGNRQVKIDKINSFLSKNLNPQFQQWFDDYNKIAENVKPIVEENKRLKNDIERMKRETAELSSNRRKRDLEEKKSKKETKVEPEEVKTTKYPDGKNHWHDGRTVIPGMPSWLLEEDKKDAEDEYYKSKYGKSKKEIMFGGRGVDPAEPEPRMSFFNRFKESLPSSPFTGWGDRIKRSMFESGTDSLFKTKGTLKELSGMQKLGNMLGKGIDLAGGPLLIAIEAATLAIQMWQQWYQKYTEDLKSAMTDVKEAYSKRDEAEDSIRKNIRDQNEDITDEEVDEQVYSIYTDLYKNLTENQKEYAKLASQGASTMDELEYDEEKDDGSYKKKEEEEVDEEEKNAEELKKNTAALYAATSQLNFALDNLQTKMTDSWWGLDGWTGKISDSFGGFLDGFKNWGTGSTFLDNGGKFLLNAQQQDENYSGYTEMAGLMLEDFKDANGEWKKGLKTMMGKDADFTTSIMRQDGQTWMSDMAKFATPSTGLSSTQNARLQASMKYDQKSWNKLAKDIAKFESKNKISYDKNKKLNTKKIEGQIDKLRSSLGEGFDRTRVLQAAYLEIAQGMFTVAQTVFVPLIQQNAQSAAQAVSGIGGVHSTVSGTGGNTYNTAAIASSIAAMLGTIALAQAGDAAKTQASLGVDLNNDGDANDANEKALQDLALNTDSGTAFMNEAIKKSKGLGEWWRTYFPGGKEIMGESDDTSFASYLEKAGIGSDRTAADFLAKVYGVSTYMSVYGMDSESAAKKYDEWYEREGKNNTPENILKTLGKNWQYKGFVDQIEQAYLNSGEEGEGAGDGAGSGSGDDGDKDKTGSKKERVDLVLCSKKEIPKLNVNLFKKPPTFTVLNKNFKVRDVKINTEDKPKAIMSSIKNAFIDVQKRSDPKIIQDEDAVYDPEGATEGNPLPSGTAKTKTDT